MEGITETKFDTKVAYRMRMMPELRIYASHSTEKARDTTLGAEK